MIRFYELKSIGGVLADFELMADIKSHVFYTSHHEVWEVLSWNEDLPIVTPAWMLLKANWAGCRSSAESEAARLGLPFVRHARSLTPKDRVGMQTGDLYYACGLVEGKMFAGEVSVSFPTNSVSTMATPRRIWQGDLRMNDCYNILYFDLFRPQ